MTYKNTLASNLVGNRSKGFGGAFVDVRVLDASSLESGSFLS